MVTQKQIAEMAGVSFATVSRALTHSAKVRPDTLQRIRSAMQALGVNNCDDFFLGRSTLSKMVLVIVGDIATEFFANILIGISDVLRAIPWCCATAAMIPRWKWSACNRRRIAVMRASL